MSGVMMLLLASAVSKLKISVTQEFTGTTTWACPLDVGLITPDPIEQARP